MRSDDVMNTSQPNSFEDPQLKAAVRRVWGSETAPATLHERIQAMGMGSASAPAAELSAAELPASPLTAMPLRSPRTGWSWPLRYPRPIYGLAAVVTMVIGFAIAYQLDQPPGWKSVSSAYTISSPNVMAPGVPSTVPSTGRMLLPASVAQRLVDTHDRCVNYASHSRAGHNGFTDLSLDDFDGLRDRLQQQLGFPVLAAPIDSGEDHWNFRGGAICPVGQTPAAHLVFMRNGQAVSIFSLPRSTCPQAGGDETASYSDADHALTVMVRPGGVHCVVGSSADGSLSSEELKTICDRLQPFLER